jgi:hypothetical protein
MSSEDFGDHVVRWFTRFFIAVQVGGALWWLWGHFRFGLVLLAAVGAWILIAWRREVARRARQGWWVTTGGGAEDISADYHEGAADRKLSLYGYGTEEQRRARWVDVPTEEEWDRKMPEWARGRRREIVTRIRAEVRWLRLRLSNGVDVTDGF